MARRIETVSRTRQLLALGRLAQGGVFLYFVLQTGVLKGGRLCDAVMEQERRLKIA